MINDYNIENQQLLKDILERNFFSKFRQGNKRFEIFLKGSCSNKCNYCYLGKHHKELYPIVLEKNIDQIIKNFEIIINWYIENHFTCEIDIFSGEWITTNLFEPIFEILYNKFAETPMAYRPKNIVIPDSLKFLNDEKLTEQIQEYINKFHKLFIKIHISGSIDGKYCDNNPLAQEDEFYRKCTMFCLKNNFGLHPMISSSNVYNWIKNYEWFKETFSDDYINNTLFMLEVRDETWTLETIQQYIDFLDFLIDDKFKNHFESNKNEFLKYILKIDDYSNFPNQLIQLSNYGLTENRNRITCSIQDTFPIRVGDFAIGLCHRLFYDELLIGNLIIENDKVIDIKETNVSLQILKDHIKKDCLPICEECIINGICAGHCLGNGYENFKNPLVPPLEVCHLLKAKYVFLFYKYEQMGLFETLENSKFLLKSNPLFKSYLLDLRKNLLQDNITYEKKQ